MGFVIQVAIDALSLGSVYALAALGKNLVPLILDEAAPTSASFQEQLDRTQTGVS